MKAAFRKDEKVSLKEVTLPALESDAVRLRVAACGVCGTDLRWHSRPARESPFGHEVAGVVLETGRAVTHLKVGQAVVLESSSACGRCAACRNMRQELCTDVRGFGDRPVQGFAEEMIAPARCAVPYEGMGPDIACLSEPLAVALDTVRVADVSIDSNVLILGPGPIGLMILQLVRRHGARRVFVAGHARQPQRLEQARRLGADDAFDTAAMPVAEFEYGCPIDRIIVTSPPSTLPGTFDVAAKGGIVTFIGLGEGEKAVCSFDANPFHFKKLQLRASFAAPAMLTPLALTHLREGVIDGEALISHRFPLTDIAAALETAANDRDAVKVVVMP